MLGKIIGAFVMIAIAVAVFPFINTSVKSAQMNITSTPSDISGTMVQMLDWVPLFFIATIALIVVMSLWRAFADSGDEYDSSGSGSSDDEDEKDDDESKESKETKKRSTTVTTTTKMERNKSSTIVTTTTKTGSKKLNVKLGPGYNVDKYELDKPLDNRLSYKEENFKKTKYD